MISQYAKEQPDERVDAWLEAVDARDLYLSTVTIAELTQGVELLPPGRKRRELDKWLEQDLLDRFHGRILSLELNTARHFGRLMARARRAGFSPGAMDGLIAATALANEMVLATLNRKDFAPLGVSLLEW